MSCTEWYSWNTEGEGGGGSEGCGLCAARLIAYGFWLMA